MVDINIDEDITLDLSTEENQKAFIELFMNLYLYGQENRPEYFGDHIRDNRDASVLEFDIGTFMTEGLGKYIKP